MKKLAALFIGLVFACPVFAQQVALQQEEAEPGLYLILDGSWSMDKAFSGSDNRKKIEVAREALELFVNSVPRNYELALRTFSGCKKEDQRYLPFAPWSRASDRVIQAAKELNPDGGTALYDSLDQGLKDFGARPGELIIISDGMESCSHRKACDLLKEQVANGILKVRLHVIGLGLQGLQRENVECIAETAGTEYHDVRSADEFSESLKEVQSEFSKTYHPPQPLPPDETGPTDSTEFPTKAGLLLDLISLIAAIGFMTWAVRDATWGPTVILVMIWTGIFYRAAIKNQASLALGLLLAIAIVLFYLAKTRRNAVFAVLVVMIVAVLQIFIGFTDVGPFENSITGLLSFQAMLAWAWIIVLTIVELPSWLRAARSWGLLALGTLSLLLVIVWDELHLGSEISQPGLGLTLVNIVLVLALSLGPLILGEWHSKAEFFLQLIASISWFLAGFYFLVVQVFGGSQWALPIVVVGVLLQVVQLASLRSHFKAWAECWPREQVERILHWGSVALAVVLLGVLTMTGTAGVHLWLLAIFLLVRLGWEGLRPARPFELTLFLVLLAACCVAFFSPGPGSLIERWSSLNWIPFFGLLFALLVVGIVLQLEKPNLEKWRNWWLQLPLPATGLAWALLVFGLLEFFSRLSLPWWLYPLLVAGVVAAALQASAFALLVVAVVVGLALFFVNVFMGLWALLGMVVAGVIVGSLGGIEFRYWRVREPEKPKERERYILRIPYHDGMLSCGGHQSLEKEFSLLLAVKLHERGRLTSKLAAEIAGLPEEQFLESFLNLRCPPAKEVPVIKEVVREVIREVPVIREVIREDPECGKIFRD